MSAPASLGLDVIVVGASAGAIDALGVILPALPVGFPVAVLVVVHLAADRPSLLSEIFARVCPLPVHEAEDKEPILPGTVYFAPPDYHMLIEVDRTIALSVDDPVVYSRPSIDVLFESAARAFGPRVLGVLLTGANHDGANGLKAIARAGGTTVVQDPATAHARAMPEAGILAADPDQVLSVPAIAAYLAACTTTGVPS